MKCKRPKHSLTPFRVVWLTACRFTQRPCGQYSSVGGICQISRLRVRRVRWVRRGRQEKMVRVVEVDEIVGDRAYISHKYLK